MQKRYYLLTFLLIPLFCTAHYRLRYDHKTLTRISGTSDSHGYWSGDAEFSSELGTIKIKDKTPKLEISINNKLCAILDTEGGKRWHYDPRTYDFVGLTFEIEGNPEYLFGINKGKLTIDAQGQVMGAAPKVFDDKMCTLIGDWSEIPGKWIPR